MWGCEKRRGWLIGRGCRGAVQAGGGAGCNCSHLEICTTATCLSRRHALHKQRPPPAAFVFLWPPFQKGLFFVSTRRWNQSAMMEQEKILYGKIWKGTKSLAIIGIGSALKRCSQSEPSQSIHYKLLWKNEMNFSSLLVREYIYQLYNELVVGIASKLEQRTKKEKKSGCGELMIFVLLPTSQRLTFISTLLLLNSCFFPPGSGSGCGSGGGGVRGGGGGEDGPSMDLPDIFCSLGSLIAEGRLPRWEQQKWNESTFHRNIGNWVSGEWFQFLWVFCHPSWQAVCYRTPEKPSSVPHCINKDISWVHWPFHLILIKCVMFCWSLWYQWLQLRNCVPRVYMYKGTSPRVPDSISLVGGISPGVILPSRIRQCQPTKR